MKPRKEFVNISGVIKARLHGRFTIGQLDKIKKEIDIEQKHANVEALGNSVDFIMQLNTDQREFMLEIWNAYHHEMKVTLATLPFVSLLLLHEAINDVDEDDQEDDDPPPFYITKAYKILDKVFDKKIASLKKEGWKAETTLGKKERT